MCNWKSGELVKVSETDCDVYCLDGDSSHNNIRKHYGIPEAYGTGIADKLHTPVEFIPRRGFKNLSLIHI